MELQRRLPARNDEAKIREYEKAIKRFAGVRIEGGGHPAQNSNGRGAA
ncbi:MAG: hypothetical protein K2M99_03760 [Treponemataceae bacterium]|nr:hypothetical protein [Treponemataceae bacterium]